MDYFFQYPAPGGSDADMLDAGPVGELAAAAEQSGWHGMAFTEHPSPSIRWLEAGGHQSFDPLVALAFAAAATTHLRLLTYLVVAPYRNPLLLAKSAATLDKLSKGRLILGTGAGYLKSEFFALGADFGNRNRAFDEALELMPQVWQGRPVTYQGANFDARDVIQAPPPVQQPIPIWVGGNSRAALRRVARYAQGWMPLGGPAQTAQTSRTTYLESIDAMAEKIRWIRDAAGERGGELAVCAPYPNQPGLNRADVARHEDALAHFAEIGVTAVVVSLKTNYPGATRDFILGFGETYLS